MTKIYFICDGDFVKIGISDNPEKRLSHLQTSNPKKLTLLYTMDGNETLEKLLHSIFSQYRVRGEWFEYTGSLYEFIYLSIEEGYTFTKINPDHSPGMFKAEIPEEGKIDLEILEKHLPKTERDKKRVLIDVVKELSVDNMGMVPVNILVNEMGDRYNMDIETVDNLISDLAQLGLIFFPSKGYVKTV